MGIKIRGTGSYTPDKIRTNADLEKMVETNDGGVAYPSKHISVF